MLQQAEAIAEGMDPLTIASTVSAVGRLKLKAPGLLDRLLAAALPLLPAFDAKVGSGQDPVTAGCMVQVP